MNYKLRINPVAISDVLAIKAYIAEDNLEAATRVVDTLYSKMAGLIDFPEMGTPLRTKINIRTDYRFLICGSYLIFYKIEAEYISVYRILNGMQDYLSVLFSKDLSEKQDHPSSRNDIYGHSNF